MSEDVKAEAAPAVDQRLEKLAALRRSFPKEVIGVLPKLSCKDCTKGRGTCTTHPKRVRCDYCANFISPAHIHIDYVGHAAVTDRLLEADPEWNWEPLAWAENGLPLFILGGDNNPLGLWIKLTICGVTRLGFGSVDGDTVEPEKELIGSAIKNAAMRFGVALKLWTKDELESTVRVDDENPADRERERVLAEKTRRPKKEKPDTSFTPEEKAQHEEAFGGPAPKSEPAPLEPAPLEPVMVCGLPVWRRWDELRSTLIGDHAAKYGGGVPSAKPTAASVAGKPWSWASEGSANGERAAWLEKLVGRARERHGMGEALPVNLQAAVLAYDAMQARISPPPPSTKDDERNATCPATIEEV